MLSCPLNEGKQVRRVWTKSAAAVYIARHTWIWELSKGAQGTQFTQGPHERLLPLRNWTEKRFIFSNTGVHSGDKSGNRIFRNVWPFEKLRVENWQICLNTTGRIFIILPRLMVILPALFDFSRPWRFISAQKSYWTPHFCHTLI